MKRKFLKISINSLTVIFFTSCLSVAKISSFSETSDGINFDYVSSKQLDKNESAWTSKTSNEYYFETNKVIEKNILFDSMIESLKNEGYTIKSAKRDNNCVIGERGLRANEWKSIIGIYFKNDYIRNKTQVYLLCKITQDITGGWKENRAKKVGVKLENMIK